MHVLRHRAFLLAVLERFSVRPPKPADDPVADHIALRRNETPARWRHLLPGNWHDVSMAAFTAEMRRIGLVLTLTITTLVMILFNTLLNINILLGAAAGLLLSGIVWYFWVKMRSNKRLLRIEESVPEALDMIVRSLRIGLPVSTALQVAGQELTGPLADEFSETSRRISYGQEPVRALREMAERCRNQSLRFLAAAVALQAATGGNLAEVLERLCAIARGRQQLQRKVRSITAEAKWSGRFLSFFPIGATIMLLSINPDYFSEISNKPFFIPMLCVVAGLLFMNILFMRWLVKIE
ncbi:pilus assembly protein TadB [Xinfangfangia sp. D13-10-4-6]|uniref:type II secretion system F family protein n=1 Tax=Pseudogemmobacter hezensis TaxID=2737662 RepID=UPI0015533958|nr:type II secretion system F family protein [Pseudogemmobacter hezensis]NPD17280.1 pilus assembly protein TadB [Pseudogemmobacter hezensis]